VLVTATLILVWAVPARIGAAPPPTMRVGETVTVGPEGGPEWITADTVRDRCGRQEDLRQVSAGYIDLSRAGVPAARPVQL
jgi:hypothetical protein